jgi:SAM-dependent methyltransferase
MTDPNARFSGSIPAAYDRYLGPMLFQPYAEHIAARLAHHAPDTVLEVACGTGIVTKALLTALPSAGIIATDLNDSMLDYARSRLPWTERLEWRQADACALPFEAARFDAVLCQFGLMFVPDKALAMREARRVLRPGGHLVFSVWDELACNPIGQIAHDTITNYFPDDPPDFYKVPFGLSDHALISALAANAGFGDIVLDTVKLEARSPTALDAATGLVNGNPVSAAIRERGVTDPSPIIQAVAEALARVGGGAPFRVPMQAIVISARA